MRCKEVCHAITTKIQVQIMIFGSDFRLPFSSFSLLFSLPSPLLLTYLWPVTTIQGTLSLFAFAACKSAVNHAIWLPKLTSNSLEISLVRVIFVQVCGERGETVLCACVCVCVWGGNRLTLQHSQFQCSCSRSELLRNRNWKKTIFISLI